MATEKQLDSCCTFQVKRRKIRVVKSKKQVGRCRKGRHVLHCAGPIRLQGWMREEEARQSDSEPPFKRAVMPSMQ